MICVRRKRKRKVRSHLLAMRSLPRSQEPIPPALESVGRKSSLFPSRSIHVSRLISDPCILLQHYYYFFICFIFFGFFRCTTFFHVNSPSRNQLLACMFSMFLSSLANGLYFLLPPGIHIIKENVQFTDPMKILLLLSLFYFILFYHLLRCYAMNLLLMFLLWSVRLHAALYPVY